MPKNFSVGKLKWKGAAIKEPRVVMRALLGVLLVANLAAAVVAFKPFGGSADDLRREQQQLSAQLKQLQARIATSRRLVDKVKKARSEGDGFLAKYFLDQRVVSASLLAELTQMASGAGIKMGQATAQAQGIEGSDTLYMLSIQAGFEGNYAGLTKFVNLVDRSPRFLIIENMQANAPQGPGSAAGNAAAGGQSLSITLKIDTFVKAEPGAMS